MWSLRPAAERVGGRLLGADLPFSAVVTDSRADCTGALFVALRGERFDGHDYVAGARAKGAAAALVDHALPLDLPQWVVADTRLALGSLAAAWRARFPGRVAAVTGSNGKTTVKELLAAILSQVGPTRATQGNLNNDIGMPLTLLRAREEAFLVLEMGANHPGEIAYMTAIGQPEVALITNAGRAHLEGFGSLEGVARAKGEIAQGLPPDGVFVVPGDSPYTPLWQGLAAGRAVLTFALDTPADLWAASGSIASRWDADGFRTAFVANRGSTLLPLELRLAGVHNVRNALAAAAAALALGVGVDAVRAGLLALAPVPGRLCPRTGSGRRIIDDTYNANPDSVAAAVAVLTGLPGRPWLVLGDLGELGPRSLDLHREAGSQARAAGIERLFCVGTRSAAAADAFGPGAQHFADQAALIAHLRAAMTPDTLVLIKGSRAARMELVLNALCGNDSD
ncbi:UDP-N-acetylmuramoyl-tripeptide--D-alanyl-D-alanine ligase [Candidatus Thiodictyon syntrophicum]|uniref:UDP-N-acetylmuramoyl-tripeptide--D-alanyl-D-alanine ligase n=1 Tax=Candidatus Thiodictyon syntrophicum TaxID=1166950 RepID=A0A2K8U3F0_9GAMM|nr:UDP-N-acetylmuramoyl-tripeptide--D-alanyl-D-alanine ligase [Candidatus Thiodictyon syntrophicum]AUB80116.1 UDP-N-acetylmuramoylalanyl-D-glutamate--2,6-diaminopimelate ligase [Candidatus Thiodictyon syntrophicum]